MSLYTLQSFQYEPATKSKSQWIVVIGAHLLMVWLGLVVTGHSDALQVVTMPNMVLIEDVAIVPKPPAPKQIPKVRKDTIVKPDIKTPTESENAIELATSSEPYQPKFEPTATSAPTLPPKVEAALICPFQIKPEIPRQAVIKNIEGLIKVEATVVHGAVRDVRFLSGPRIFFDSVRSAMMQYKCAVRADSVVALQEFNFHFD